MRWGRPHPNHLRPASSHRGRDGPQARHRRNPGPSLPLSPCDPPYDTPTRRTASGQRRETGGTWALWDRPPSPHPPPTPFPRKVQGDEGPLHPGVGSSCCHPVPHPFPGWLLLRRGGQVARPRRSSWPSPPPPRGPTHVPGAPPLILSVRPPGHFVDSAGVACVCPLVGVTEDPRLPGSSRPFTYGSTSPDVPFRSPLPGLCADPRRLGPVVSRQVAEAPLTGDPHGGWPWPEDLPPGGRGACYGHRHCLSSSHGSTPCSGGGCYRFRDGAAQEVQGEGRAAGDLENGPVGDPSLGRVAPGGRGQEAGTDGPGGPAAKLVTFR